MPGTHGETLSDPSAGPANERVLSMVLVTLAALAVYRAGCHLPLPGLNTAALKTLLADSSGSTKALERVSVFALGIVPLLSVMMLAEIAKLVSRDFREWAVANGAYLNKLVRAAGIVLTALQALGLAVALEAVPSLVAEPGPAFWAGAVATMVAGTAFLMWLADVITCRGVGSGFWILLAAPAVAALPEFVTGHADLIERGIVPPEAAILIGGYLVLGTAAVVAVSQADGGPGVSSGVGVWPPMLAFATFGWIMAALLAISPAEWRETVMEALQATHPVKLIVPALLAGAFTLLYARLAENARAVSGLGAVGAAAMIALLLAPELIATYFNLPLVFDGRWLVILATVALSILAAVNGTADAKDGEALR